MTSDDMRDAVGTKTHPITLTVDNGTAMRSDFAVRDCDYAGFRTRGIATNRRCKRHTWVISRRRVLLLRVCRMPAMHALWRRLPLLCCDLPPLAANLQHARRGICLNLAATPTARRQPVAHTAQTQGKRRIRNHRKCGNASPNAGWQTLISRKTMSSLVVAALRWRTLRKMSRPDNAMLSLE